MIISVLIGSSLAGTYSYTLQKTILKGSRRSLVSELFWGLGGFVLRLFSIVLIFFSLAQIPTLDISWIIIAFTITFSVLLFYAAGKVLVPDLKRRGVQPVRRA